MKRFIALALYIVLITLVLVACSNEGTTYNTLPTTSEPAPAVTDATTEIM